MLDKDPIGIVDKDSSRRYFTQIPNLLAKLGLTPSTFLVYFHIKMVTGEDPDGVCWKSLNTLAKETELSVATIRRAKKALAKKRPSLGNKPLIVVTVDKSYPGKPRHRVTVVDLWEENIDFFRLKPKSRSKTVVPYDDLSDLEED